MGRTARKVDELLEETPELESAIEHLLDVTGAGDDEVEWADVRGELTSGQWGRIIETGILVDGETGFRFADADAVAEALSYERSPQPTTSSGGSSEEPESVSWSTWDKAAAVGSISLFAGYSLPQIRNAIGSTIDVLLGPLDAALPFYVVVMVLALLTGLYSTLLQANLMDMEVMGQYQSRMQEIQERQKAAKERGDDEELEQIRKEQMDAMGDQLGMFKAQFRPMVWIMLFTIPVFLWMYWMILEGRIAELENTLTVPLAGEKTWQQSVAGPIQLWIVWYFICSMAFTQVIRKALNIQTTPTG
ncbi:MAG: DUF106 domain-containing protein [Halobacteriales archaeon]|nr:DUF106 domain-containing protein [Halobacteriales archaeon]